MTAEQTAYYTYILLCGDNTLYIGWTTDLRRRVAVHNSGRGAKYTRNRRPVRLVYWESHSSKREAMSREWALKQLTRQQKLDLINQQANLCNEVSEWQS